MSRAPLKLVENNASPRVTVFPNVSAQNKRDHSWSFEDLAEKVAKPINYTSKAECPLIKYAEFSDKRTASGCLRHNDNVVSISGIEGDYDAGMVSVNEARAKLEAAGIQAIIYTTASHTESNPRWRILAPLSKGHPPADHGKYVAILNGVLAGILAPESFNLSQSYYFGRVIGVVYEYAVVEGSPIDTLPALEMFAQGDKSTTNNKSELPKPTPPAIMLEITAEAMTDLHDAVINGLSDARADDYQSWTDTGLALASFKGTAHEEWALNLFHEFSTRSSKYDHEDCQKKWKSFNPNSITYKSIFKCAQDDGWRNPHTVDTTPLFSAVEPTPIIGRPTLKRHTTADLTHARMTPRVIVPNYLYADVRILISAGGVGKTTHALHEAVTLSLRRPLYGHQPDAPVRTVLITREDSAETLLGRLREVCKAVLLNDEQIEQVLENVRIFDLSPIPFRLSKVTGDMVTPDMENIDWLASEIEPFKPDRIIFDPLISFGVGESRVNDAEQGIIEAFRIIRNRFNCCVEGIHHSGKQNARDKTLDQYSGRGGSALADGARMVAVMQPLTSNEWMKVTGQGLGEHETGLVMALPKMSYCKQSEPVYIRRNGFSFTPINVVAQTPDQQRETNLRKLADWIDAEFIKGKYYSSNELEKMYESIGMTRSELRVAAIQLKNEQRFIYHDMGTRKGSHYEPVSSATPDGGSEGKPA